MTIDKLIPNEDLLEACYQGNTDAISLFYARFKDLVYHAIHTWINKYAKDEDRDEDVREIFQQAILELIDNGFAKLKQVRDANKPSALIFLISYQCAGRYFKAKWKERNRRIDPLDEVTLGAENTSSRGEVEVYKLIGAFLGTLSDAEREVFELRFRQEMKFKHIAFRTGLSIDNVGVMLSRIKDKFKSFVKEKYPDAKSLL